MIVQVCVYLLVCCHSNLLKRVKVIYIDRQFGCFLENIQDKSFHYLLLSAALKASIMEVRILAWEFNWLI